MFKYILAFLPLLSLAQTKVFRASDVIEYNATKEIPVFDGMVIKWRLPDMDTARFLKVVDNGEYEVTTTVRLIPKTKPDIPTVIDDKPQTANAYSAGWTHAANNDWNVNHNDKTISYTLTKDNILTTAFTGYRVEWWTEKRLNHGTAAVSIDGGQEVEVDLYEKTEENKTSLVWTSPPLTNGPHTIRVRMTGDKNPAWNTDYPVGHSKRFEAQGNNITHDFFRVVRAQ